MNLENTGNIQESTPNKQIPLSTERKPDYFKIGGKVVLVNPNYNYVIETGKTTKHGYDSDHNLDLIEIELDVDRGCGNMISGFQIDYCGLMTREDYDYLHANPDFAKDWVNKHNKPNKEDTTYDLQEKQEIREKIINAIVNKPFNLDYSENNTMQRDFDLALKKARK